MTKKSFDFAGNRPKSIDSLVIDCSNLAHRYSNALRRFQTSDGRLSGHVHGAFVGIKAMWAELRPKNLVFVYDRGSAWRRELVPSYKATRRIQDSPSEIENGIVDEAINAPGDIKLPVYMRNFTPAFDVERLTRSIPGIHLSAPDQEADDMAAAFLKVRTERLGTIVLYTGDKDFWQCVSSIQGIVCLQPSRENGKLVYQWVDESHVNETLQVSPKAIPKWKALLGDDSDNIEGLSGASKPGKKQILREFASSPLSDAFFDITNTSPSLGLESWLADPMMEQRSRLINNYIVAQMGRRAPEVSLTVTEPDIANAMGILAEFECESLLEKVVPWFRQMAPELPLLY
jgi:5'-3' exonuclease